MKDGFQGTKGSALFVVVVLPNSRSSAFLLYSTSMPTTWHAVEIIFSKAFFYNVGLICVLQKVTVPIGEISHPLHPSCGSSTRTQPFPHEFQLSYDWIGTHSCSQLHYSPPAQVGGRESATMVFPWLLYMKIFR